MKIELKVSAKNSLAEGRVTCDSKEIFNFDALMLEHSKDETEFIETLGEEWSRVPETLLDPTTRKNFIYYARLPL